MHSTVCLNKEHDDPEGEETAMVEGPEIGGFFPESSRRMCRHLRWNLGAWLLALPLPL